MSLDTRQRAQGAYLGLAVGDALGATVEFMTPREIRALYGTHDKLIGGGWLRLRPGQVTDDTEMSLALGASILAEGGVRAQAVAASFSDWMRGKPVDIGHTVRRGIAHFRRTGETLVPYDDYGAGNGACMRCLPIALATLGQGPDRVRQATLAQAHITHHSRLSDAGTLLVVELIQVALLGADLETLEHRVEHFCTQHPEFRSRPGKRTQNPGGFIVETLQAVFEALFEHREFTAALVDVVNRGGDADTTGAILGMIAGAHWGLGAIPQRWLRKLEPTTAESCSQQALALLELSRRNAA